MESCLLHLCAGPTCCSQGPDHGILCVLVCWQGQDLRHVEVCGQSMFDGQGVNNRPYAPEEAE